VKAKTKKSGGCNEDPRLTEADEMTHHQSEIVCSNSDQVTLANILQASQPCSTSTTRFADVSEAAFDDFTATLLQGSALRTLHPLAVAADRVLHAVRLIPFGGGSGFATLEDDKAVSLADVTDGASRAVAKSERFASICTQIRIKTQHWRRRAKPGFRTECSTVATEDAMFHLFQIRQ